MNAPISTALHDPTSPRHAWTLDEIEALFDLPFTELKMRPMGQAARGEA